MFSIPFQTRKILYFTGWKFNEWQSISLYATDIVLILLFVFWFFDFRLKINKYDYFLLAFVVVSAISVKNSSNILISWFQWLKLVEFVCFYFYLRNYAIYKLGFTNTLFAIFWGGLFQAAISITQFIGQSSLGISYLGESVFSADIKGVAAFYNFYGDKIIRAYGTTPHPNILAAYLFLALFSFYFIWFYKRISYDRFLFLGHLITLWAFFLTFSRTAIFILGANYVVRGYFLFVKFRKLKSKRVWQIIVYTGITMSFFIVVYWPEIISRVNISGNQEAVQLRNFYNKESAQIISWTGTGIGDFVNELAIRVPMLADYLYQPVHNVYLLIYAETGVLGISMFVLFLAFLVRDFVLRTKMQRFHHYSLMLLFSSFLFMGLFDHFLWTIQQGRFLFWLIIAALAVEENEDIEQ